jgi:hypothetical protein
MATRRPLTFTITHIVFVIAWIGIIATKQTHTHAYTHTHTHTHTQYTKQPNTIQ